ncbi:hypothetical protein [uncultured Bradyrhizobium sp.]|jgi:hypothetical protein|uniref:hypothetical protein n=1 Tax=uncultured Bradyrhizobium sp. TaxID=199684 RepID=UPI00263A20EA|nr:hypothetical protein [uncultured Bradyrhizobium sp.]
MKGRRTETHHNLLSLAPLLPRAEMWHVREVILPRRSITGAFVRGKILRRYDGHRWIYKPFERSTD